MSFELQFKLAYLLIVERGGDYEKVFAPKLEQCSIAYDNGDTEIAGAMLKFCSEKIVELLEV